MNRIFVGNPLFCPKSVSVPDTSIFKGDVELLGESEFVIGVVVKGISDPIFYAKTNTLVVPCFKIGKMVDVNLPDSKLNIGVPIKKGPVFN